MTRQIPQKWFQPDRDAHGFTPLMGEPNPFASFPRSRWPVGGPADGEYPLNELGSEQELVDAVARRLERWFVVEREVWGKHCSGRDLRVDAMIRPRDPSNWANPDVAFGVEFKASSSLDGVKGLTKWFAQAVDYTHVDWPGYGRCVVLMCPGADAWMRAQWSVGEGADLHIFKRVMGQQNVGELVLRWDAGFSILVNDGKVWSERYGVANGKNWSLSVRTGAR